MRKLFYSLLIFYFYSVPLFSQTVENSDFENWSTAFGVDYPDHWATSDQLYFLKGLKTRTVSKNIESFYGNYSVKLWPDTGKKQLLPAYIVGSYAYNAHPKYFIFQYKDSLTSKDNGYVILKLKKWNSLGKKSDSIGGIKWAIPQLLNGRYARAVIPVGYTSSDTSILADSVQIQFTVSSSSLKRSNIGSVKIDALYLGNKTSLSENLPGFLPLNCYPNPAGNTLYIKLDNEQQNICQVYNLEGKLCGSYTVDAGTGVKTINTSGLNNGLYFIRLLSNGSTYSGKILIQK
jgi:hypothetical protein